MCILHVPIMYVCIVVIGANMRVRLQRLRIFYVLAILYSPYKPHGADLTYRVAVMNSSYLGCSPPTSGLIPGREVSLRTSSL